MSDWILMTKGDEEKLVHPGNVDNHLRAGWGYAELPVVEAPVVEQEDSNLEDADIQIAGDDVSTDEEEPKG